MLSVTRSLWLGAAAAAVFVHDAGAQETTRQALKDAWVATSQQLLEADFGTPSALVVKNPGDASRDFKALAFEAPTLGATGGAARGLIAVSGTEVFRFENGSNETPPKSLFDAATTPLDLRFVTSVAVTDTGTILVSGYSRPKRVFEIWEVTLPATVGAPLIYEARATSTPQLTDTVFVKAEDVVAGSLLGGGGLLATAGKQVLFFPKRSDPALSYEATVVVLDGKALGLKGATELTSVDLVRDTNTLMIATTERKLLTVPAGPGAVTAFASIPPITGRNCAALKPQRLVVRNAQGGNDGSTFVSDACGQVLLYDFTSATSPMVGAPTAVTSSSGLLALAVGEGNEVTCQPNVSCPLISGAFDAFIEAEDESELLVLQFPDLCDRRVSPGTCGVGVTNAGTLILNSLLPESVQAALRGVASDPTDDVAITIPPYLFAAGYNGRFGVVFVQADDNAASAAATIELDIADLVDNAFELGVDVGLARPTAVLDLLNQDVAAYAPDNPSLPTVRGFEASPITVGVRNPMRGALRGFSAIIYGLQHDLNPPAGAGLPRDPAGGLPAGTALNYGSQRLCELRLGSQRYSPIDNSARYFMNLAACLFADQEELLNAVIPAAAFDRSTDRAALITSLNQVKDKLIKALSGAGPNTGSETFQALYTQLGQFDATLAVTPFDPLLEIYKNELQVRSKVFRFNLAERTYPSLPTNGF